MNHKYEYDIRDYLNAIYREKDKRDKTYPKMIAKMEKRGDHVLDVAAQCSILGCQFSQLDAVRKLMLYNDPVTIEEKSGMLNELIREYKMRRKCYPRFVMFKRMTPETAEYEMGLWRELCIYFADIYIGSAQLALDYIQTKTRRRHADPS